MFSGELTQYTRGCQHCGWGLKREYTGETLTAVPRFAPPKTTNELPPGQRHPQPEGKTRSAQLNYNYWQTA